jgi:hypothetical protein
VSFSTAGGGGDDDELNLVIDPSFVITKVKFSSTSVAAYFLE